LAFVLDSGSSNEESGVARRRPQRRRPRKQEPEANGRPIVVENSGPASRLYSTISSKEGSNNPVSSDAVGSTKATATPVAANNSSINSSSSTSQQPAPREQRSRPDKSTGGRKQPAIDAPKGNHEGETVNGTSA